MKNVWCIGLTKNVYCSIAMKNDGHVVVWCFACEVFTGCNTRASAEGTKRGLHAQTWPFLFLISPAFPDGGLRNKPFPRRWNLTNLFLTRSEERVQLCYMVPAELIELKSIEMNWLWKNTSWTQLNNIPKLIKHIPSHGSAVFQKHAHPATTLNPTHTNKVIFYKFWWLFLQW